jgi:RNA polymerase sigma-70 factor (ECF subfamily)
VPIVDPTVEALVTAPALGDPAGSRSFEAFYDRHLDRVYRAVGVALGDPDVARDAVDEAMARACARWRTVGHYDDAAGWVYRVAINWATSRWRKRRREDLVGDAPTTSGPGDDGWRAAPVVDALARLPLAQRSVVVCRVLLDLDTAQTAKALGIPAGTAKSRLARGLAALRRDMEEATDG